MYFHPVWFLCRFFGRRVGGKDARLMGLLGLLGEYCAIWFGFGIRELVIIFGPVDLGLVFQIEDFSFWACGFRIGY
jgi:hypothetical protein